MSGIYSNPNCSVWTLDFISYAEEFIGTSIRNNEKHARFMTNYVFYSKYKKNV